MDKTQSMVFAKEPIPCKLVANKYHDWNTLSSTYEAIEACQRKKKGNKRYNNKWQSKYNNQKIRNESTKSKTKNNAGGSQGRKTKNILL